MRITVYDILEYLASGMSEEEILSDFSELTSEDIKACLAFAADREKKLFVASLCNCFWTKTSLTRIISQIADLYPNSDHVKTWHSSQSEDVLFGNMPKSMIL
jgi:hypothetical protein